MVLITRNLPHLHLGKKKHKIWRKESTELSDFAKTVESLEPSQESQLCVDNP